MTHRHHVEQRCWSYHSPGSMHLYSAEQPNELDSEQEYLTWAEIYISNAASTTLRKVNKHYWLLD